MFYSSTLSFVVSKSDSFHTVNTPLYENKQNESQNKSMETTTFLHFLGEINENFC